jgi:two-component system phosphate regulon sensor histidine kinase PhoR
MPRTGLLWRLFTGWCSLVAAVLVGCYWLASVRLADLADTGQRRRLQEVAGAVAAGLSPDALPTADAFREQAVAARGTAPIMLELVAADGAVVATVGADRQTAERFAQRTLDPQPSRSRADARSLATSRFDAASGRRYLVVTSPLGPSAAPTGLVRASRDTAESDADLARALWMLFVGELACGVAAVGAGYLACRRAAEPVEDLARSVTSLAAGETASRLPVSDVREIATIIGAVESLQEQFEERGLLIGRQGTQQEAVLGSMIEGVVAIDARQRIVGINRAAAELLGLDLEHAVRRPLQEVVRNPDLRRFALLAIVCREPVEDDLVLRGARDRTIRMRGTALRDVTGEGGAVIVLNDVTDMQRLERVRRDFVANVSHELKTPIASIKGFVETLLDGAADDPVDGRRFLEIVAKQADRLAAIIEDLLALSRIEQSEGSGNLPLEPARIADVVAAAVTECGPRAADKSIRIRTACPDALVAEVNPPLLEQALINLVDNAIKYSDQGRTTWIEASGADDEAVVITVRDEGRGIGPEHLPRLFERFYRVDSARSRALGGTGLGLSIVKHIVQAHGGTVTVESTVGMGTTFTMRLPRDRAG